MKPSNNKPKKTRTLVGESGRILEYLFNNPEELNKVDFSLYGGPVEGGHQLILAALQKLGTKKPEAIDVAMAAGLEDDFSIGYVEALRNGHNPPDANTFKLYCQKLRERKAEVVEEKVEAKPGEDWEELQDVVEKMVKESRTPLLQIEILRKLERTYNIVPSSRPSFLRHVIKPLLAENRIFQEKPKAPYLGSRPLVECSEPIVGESFVLEANNYYPILPVFNDLLAGGVCPGEIVLWNAGYGQGKTYHFLHIAKNAVELGLKVKYIDLEMGPQKIHLTLQHVLGNNLVNHQMADPERFSYQYMEDKRITDAYLEDCCRKYDVIIVDYLKFEKFTGGIEAAQGGYSKGAAILQTVAAKINVHNTIFVSGNQVRNRKGSGKNATYNLSGGDSWAEPASVVLSIVDREDNGDNIGYTAKVEKCRNIGNKRRMLPGQVLTYSANKKTTSFSWIGDNWT